jgi:protein ImuA
VLAWLPQRLRADALRRLQIAAQSHDGPVFLLREIDARLKPSAAPLRLSLGCAGIDLLALRLLKRRGPPLAGRLALVLPPVLTERLRARAQPRDAVPPVRSQAFQLAALSESANNTP